MSGVFEGIGGWLNAHFLALMSAAIGASITIPAVVILYFLKLKRKEQVVSSTLLWRRVLEDLRVNAPFQRLRTNLLLLLQLLILLALVIALARPFSPGAAGGQVSSLVILIDQSASMSTRDVESKTRLEAARQAALNLVGRMPAETRAAVVAFAAGPRVMSGLTHSRAELEAAINKIAPTGERTDLDTALQVADGLAGAAGRNYCRVIIYSDAALPASRPLKQLGSDTKVELRSLGKKSDNVGITSLEARRLLGGESQVFVRLNNFGSVPVKRRVFVYMGDRKEAADARDVELPAGARKTELFERLKAPPGATPVRVELYPAADALPSDDIAWAALPPERALKVLAYSSDHNFLDKALHGLPGTEVRRGKAEDLQAAAEAAAVAWAGSDAVIFDGCAPKALPTSGGFLFINAAPPLPGAELGAEVKAPIIVDWDRIHPLARFASLEGLLVAKGRPVKIGRGQVALAESSAGPLVAAWQHEQLRVVVVGFDLYESNWPLRLSFPIFMANSARWLAEANPSWAAEALRCGEPIALRASYWPEAAGRESVKVSFQRPDGKAEDMEVRRNAPRLVASTAAPGLYRAVGPGGLEALFACSVLDEAESDNSARDSLNFAVSNVRGATTQLAGAGAARSVTGREFWKYAALAALAVFLFEWYIYNRRLWG